MPRSKIKYQSIDSGGIMNFVGKIKLTTIVIILLLPNYLWSQSKDMIKLKWYHYILLSPMLLKTGIEDAVKGFEKSKRESERKKTITPLHEAVEAFDLEKVEDLLAQGASMDAKNHRGETPLHYAVDWNNLEIASVLLEKGANPNSKNSNGIPIIVYAIKNKNLDMVKLLISKGANAKSLITPKFENIENTQIETEKVNTSAVNYSKSLIHYACSFDPENTKMIGYLIEKGANVNSADEFGYTPLMLLFSNSEKFPFDSIKLLIKKGADVNARKLDGQSILHILIAAKSSNFEAIRFLVENGANVNSKDQAGRTIFNEIQDYYDEDQNKEIVNYLRKKRK
jgi:ankyrin repeat protein